MTISLPIPPPLQSDDTSGDDSNDHLDGTQRTIDYPENQLEPPRSNEAHTGRQQPYGGLPSTWSSRSTEIGRSMGPRIPLGTTSSLLEPAIEQPPTSSRTVDLNDMEIPPAHHLHDFNDVVTIRTEPPAHHLHELDNAI